MEQGPGYLGTSPGLVPRYSGPDPGYLGTPRLHSGPDPGYLGTPRLESGPDPGYLGTRGGRGSGVVSESSPQTPLGVIRANSITSYCICPKQIHVFATSRAGIN